MERAGKTRDWHLKIGYKNTKEDVLLEITNVNKVTFACHIKRRIKILAKNQMHSHECQIFCLMVKKRWFLEPWWYTNRVIVL